MNKLLPMLWELKPISGNRDAFGETVFTKVLEKLSFVEKLQLACDIVRQTMLTSYIPNPKKDEETMIGDSYTACNVLKHYLELNKIGVKYYVVFAKSNIFEIENATTTHFILIVYDEYNCCFQVDPSPCVGYKCGKAEKLDISWYKEYIVVEDDLKNRLETLRLMAYELKQNMKMAISDRQVRYIEECKEKYSILQGYANFLYENWEYNKANKIANKDSLIYADKKIKIVNKELKMLRINKEDYKRQLELLQWISSERKKLGLEYHKYVNICGIQYKLDDLTPRFFYENKLNLAMIKTSSFYINRNEEFKNFLCNGHMSTGGYMVNLGESQTLGFSRMIIFHPDGYKYVRYMFGPNYIFLIQDSVKNILERKRFIRNEYSPNWDGNIVKWYDGKNIEWQKLAMNLVHSADNSAEVCCNYQCGFPESQLMTRFTYPNLKMIY